MIDQVSNFFIGGPNFFNLGGFVSPPIKDFGQQVMMEECAKRGFTLTEENFDDIHTLKPLNLDPNLVKFSQKSSYLQLVYFIYESSLHIDCILS